MSVYSLQPEMEDAPSAMLDFSKIPNGMISGLSAAEIDRLMCSYEGSTSMAPNHRFSRAQSDTEIQTMAENSIPQATKNRNKWSVNLFEEWKNQRLLNILPDELYDQELQSSLLEMPSPALDYWASKFILEVRKCNGTRYPKDSLVSIVAGIQSDLKLKGRSVDFFKDQSYHSNVFHFNSGCNVTIYNNSGAPN